MWSLKFLALLVVVQWFTQGSGNLIQVKENENEEISSYVKALISDYDAKDSSTKDVVVFGIARSKNSLQKVDEVLNDIYAAIPDGVAVYSPPIGEVVRDKNLRSSSFVIIVSDISVGISKI